MNSITSTRKFVTALATIAALGLVAFALGLALDSHALALFCVTACTFTVMIAVHDYSPAPSYSGTRYASRALSPAVRNAERMALAA